MTFQRVADEQSLADEALLSAELENGDRVCLTRVGGEVFAVADCCTHAEYPLSDGSVGNDYMLECALHGAVFDVRDGSVHGAPAERPVKTYAVKIEGGGIWIELPADG